MPATTRGANTILPKPVERRIGESDSAMAHPSHSLTEASTPARHQIHPARKIRRSRDVIAIAVAIIGAAIGADCESHACAQNASRRYEDVSRLSAEFKDFTQWFHQDLLDDVTSEQELATYVLKPFTDETKRKALRAYLDAITADDISDEQLVKIWWSSPADIVFRDGAVLRAFLKRIRDRL